MRSLPSAGRLTVGLAALVVLAGAFVLARPGGSDDETPARALGTVASSSATTSTTPRAATTSTGPRRKPTPEPKPKPRPQGVLLTAGSVKTVEVEKGDTVRLRARHDTAEELHVHGYGRSVAIEPGKTAKVSFDADLEGVFEIELEQSGVQVGSLEVSPR